MNPHPHGAAPDPALPRRDFLKAGGATIAAGALAGGAIAASTGAHRSAATAASPPRAAEPPTVEPKPPPAAANRTARPAAMNLIFMAVDGMSLGTLALADLACRKRHNRPTHWTSLLRRGDARAALVETAPAEGHVPDSAASASAWGIGERVHNQAVCFTPDGRAPTPLFLEARQRGKAVGFVTTTRLTDATPACLFANAPKRSMEDDIVIQMMDRGADVMLGGGGAKFPNDVITRRAGVTLLPNRRALLDRASAPLDNQPLLGLFAADVMRHDIDREDDQPSLAEMTAAALRALESRPNGFVLCVEAARVDHAAHANDAVGLVTDFCAFDQAVEIALDFADRRGDTLIILTTDHGNANPGLATAGEAGVRQFESLIESEHTLEWALERLARMPRSERTGPALASLVREGLGVTLSNDEIDIIDKHLTGHRVDPYLRANQKSSPIGSVIANHLGVAFTGPDHTTDHVLATAVGPGSGALAPFIGIEELHFLAAAALDIPAARRR